MSYAILTSYDLTALVYVLLLRLRLATSRLVSMHVFLVSFLRVLGDMSFLSFLRILILLEEPPHLSDLTADLNGLIDSIFEVQVGTGGDTRHIPDIPEVMNSDNLLKITYKYSRRVQNSRIQIFEEVERKIHKRVV